MTSTRWGGQRRQGHGPGLPPTAVLACSVGLRPQQRACPARPLQLASVHLHPVQKGRKGDPGSEGPSERQRAGERISGGEKEMRRCTGFPGQLDGNGGQDSGKRRKERHSPPPQRPPCLYSQTLSPGAGESLSPIGMRVGGLRTQSQPWPSG